jgi:hypothetical protein
VLPPSWVGEWEGVHGDRPPVALPVGPGHDMDTTILLVVENRLDGCWHALSHILHLVATMINELRGGLNFLNPNPEPELPSNYPNLI